MPEIIWTAYLRYRVEQRGFDLNQIEAILRFSGERYYDVETGRAIAVGNHNDQLVLIPYEHFQLATPVFKDPMALTLFDDEYSLEEERWTTLGQLPNGQYGL